LAAVVRTWFANYQFLKPEPIDQADSAVVRDLELLSKFSDCCGIAPRESFDREESLILARRQTGGRSRILTEMQKLS
jgi:hypothetical protein